MIPNKLDTWTEASLSSIQNDPVKLDMDSQSVSLWIANKR